jgi:hypothetical protein
MRTSTDSLAKGRGRQVDEEEEGQDGMAAKEDMGEQERDAEERDPLLRFQSGDLRAVRSSVGLSRELPLSVEGRQRCGFPATAAARWPAGGTK